MLPSPQLHGSVAVPTPSVAPKVYQDNQSKDANNKQGIDSMLPTSQPHGSVLSPFLVLPIKYFITSKARMPIISKVSIQCSINPTPLIIVLFYLDLSSEKSGGVKVGMQEKITNLLEGNQKGVVNINNKINMTTQNDTQNMSPVLIEDIDPAAEDSLDYESMEGPELGHSDDEGEVNSGRVEVNALVQQEKGNFVYKEADSMGHFQAATQTMSQVNDGRLRTAGEVSQRSFVSCWSQLSEASMEFRNDVFFSKYPPEILATLLNLMEFMEHDERPLPIDIRQMGALAGKCRAFAKALHYKEMEFEGTLSNRRDANLVAVVVALIHINNQLHQYEVAVGILTYAQQHLGVQWKESWYEMLQIWDDALKAYTDKTSQASSPHLCLDATLARWEELNNLCKEYWMPAELEMAPMWDQMAEYVSRLDMVMKPNSESWEILLLAVIEVVMAPFFRAFLLVRRGKYDEACEYFERARKCLATELAALVLESYERAYNNTVRVQQLSELEEVIEYCTLPPMGNPIVEGRRALFPNMWNERIKGAKRNDEVNFRTSLSE
ncbi:hypothetical protein KY284_035940 [Solanum tuberosum]|nr:hypothetical protein KY284_035940 [Solanum tuberosum]